MVENSLVTMYVNAGFLLHILSHRFGPMISSGSNTSSTSGASSTSGTSNASSTGNTTSTRSTSMIINTIGGG
jgi:hypothetical protein